LLELDDAERRAGAVMNADDVCSGFKEINADKALQQSDAHTILLPRMFSRTKKERGLDLICRLLQRRTDKNRLVKVGARQN
jgi:hypothetical protein